MSEHIPRLARYDVPWSEAWDSFQEHAQGDHALTRKDLNEKRALYFCSEWMKFKWIQRKIENEIINLYRELASNETSKEQIIARLRQNLAAQESF